MSTGLVKSPRFLADENLQSAIVAGVRRKRPGITFQTAATANTLGKDDVSVLQRAKELYLILISHDRRTMYSHFATLLMQLTQGEHSPGVLLVEQNKFSIGQVIEFIVEIYDLSTHNEWQDRIVHLPL